VYEDIRDSDNHEDLKQNSSRSGGHGVANKTTISISILHCICDELYIMFDELGVDFYATN
jgi:hypothetical protein